MTTTLRLTRSVRLSIAVLAVALFGALAATQAQAALRHFDGKVVSKSSANHTFKIRTESGNRVSFRVNGGTEFDRIPGGFGGLHKGLRVEVTAKNTASGKLATKVEKHRAGGGGGGEDGGGHGGGADDGPGHH